MPAADESAEVINLADARMERAVRKAKNDGIEHLFRFIGTRERELKAMVHVPWRPRPTDPNR
jgi:hypothetical protein